MTRRFLLWLSARLPAREIKHQGQPYMERYYVATLFGYWRVYIHRFVGSDPDGLHSHPWRWGATVILAGWYLEQRRFGHRVVRWGGIVNGDTFHRVIKPEGADVWTLFVHSPRVMNWGFLRTRTFIEFRQPTQKVTIYQEVGDAEPSALSGWWKKAPKGRDLRRVA
jgi:hypothetical protein